MQGGKEIQAHFALVEQVITGRCDWGDGEPGCWSAAAGAVIAPCAGDRAGRGGLAYCAGRPWARARPMARAHGARRSGLPIDALIEFVLRCGLGVEGARPGIGQVASRRAAGGCDAGWRGRLAEVLEDVAEGGRVTICQIYLTSSGRRGTIPHPQQAPECCLIFN